MIKRLLIITLSACMLLTPTVSYAGLWDYVMEDNLYDHGIEEANGEIYYTAGTNEIGRPVKFAMDMGLITNYTPGTTVTRAELKAALKLLFKGDYMYENYYKTGEEDKILTVDEAIVVFMDAAGYEAYFETEGKSSATAYYIEASRRGLLKGINYSDAKKKLTAEQFYTMFYNALYMDTFKTLWVGSTPTYIFSEETLLESELKLTAISGVVKANSYTSLNGEPAVGKETIKIGNTEYRYTGLKDVDTYLGYSVEAYINEDGELCSIAVDERYNTMQVFNDEVEVKASGDRTVFQYYDDNGKVKTIRLDKYADVVYNHQAYPGYTADVFNIKNGYMQFIDHDGDKLYDAVLIYDYTSFMPKAKYTEDYSVTDKLGTKYDLSAIVEDKNYRGIFNSDGEAATFDDISMRFGISLLTAHDTNIVTELNIIAETTYEGKYLSYNPNKKAPYVVDEKNLMIAATYLKESGDKFPHELGDRVLVYLDPRGKVINSVVVGDRLKYGYVRRMAYEQVLGTDVKMQLFTEDERMVDYEVADKLEYNGMSVKEEYLVNGGASELYNKGVLKKQLVRYMVNADGQIKQLDTATVNTAAGAYNEGDGFEINYDCDTQGGLFYTGGAVKSFGSKYRLNSAKTFVFNIPSDDDERYYRMDSLSEIYNNLRYSVKIYDADEYYTPGAIIIDRGKTADAQYIYYDSSASFFIIQKGQFYEQVSDETLDYMTYRLGWWEQTAYKNPDHCFNAKQTGVTYGGGRYQSIETWDDLRVGDMAEFTKDYLGRAVVFSPTLALDYTMPLENQVFEVARVNGELAMAGIDEYKFYGSDLIAFGKVVKKHSEGIVFNAHADNNFGDKKWNRTIICGESQDVNIFNYRDEKCELKKFTDVQEGDFIFIEMDQGYIQAMTVYRP